MSTRKGSAGTILFQEGIITVQKSKGSPRDDAATKLPLLWDPLQFTKAGAEHVVEKTNLQGKASANLILPSIHALHQSTSAFESELLDDEVDQYSFKREMPRKPRRQNNQSPWADVKKRPGRHLRMATISNQTLAEINQAKSLLGAVVCRYDEIDMQNAMKSAAQRASRRREVIQKESAAQRVRARKKGKLKQRRKINTIVVAEADEHDTASDQAGDDAGSRHSSFRSRASNSPQLMASKPRPTMLRLSHSTLLGSSRPTMLGLGLDDPLPPVETYGSGLDKLQKIKFKSPKALRMSMLTKLRDRMKAEMQVRIRMEERQKEFELLPPSEQESLERAFRIGTDTARGSISSSTALNAQLLSHYHPAAKVAELQSSRLYNCLRELGLNGKKELEQKEVKLLCHESNSNGEVDFYGFCFDLVPMVRSKLIELRQESLAEQFAYYDQDTNGFLDREECSYMLTKLCRNMDRVGLEGVRKEFETVFDRVKVVNQELEAAERFKEYVDFEGFQMLYERVQETYECLLRDRVWKIIEVQRLESVEAKSYAEELLVLHDTFVQASRGERALPGGSTYLDGPEVYSALLEQGLMPYDASERMQVESITKLALEESSTPGRISFREFLDLIRALRDMSRLTANPRLSEYFENCDKDSNGRLSFAEASVIFEKLGMVPQCREDQDEMKSMLLKVDFDHSGDLSFEEFTHLVQHITEKLRANDRRRTNEVAQQLGFNEQQVAELREVFFNLDSQGHGDLGIDECRKTLTLLHLDMPSDQLKSLFASADKSRKGRLDLSSFFCFIEAMSRQAPRALIELKAFQSAS